MHVVRRYSGLGGTRPGRPGRFVKHGDLELVSMVRERRPCGTCNVESGRLFGVMFTERGRHRAWAFTE
eukprot:168557-Chlamydomonas_euryale.AAC.2